MRKLGLGWLLVAALLVVSAGDVRASGIGKERGGGSYLEWDIRTTGHKAVELWVLGPDGEAWMRSFAAGRNAMIRLSDLGEPEDGEYNYELRVVPMIPEGIRRQLDEARLKADDEAIRRILRNAGLTDPVVQSGHFVILNGTFVGPDAIEPGASDSNAGGPGSVSSLASPANPVAHDVVTPDDQITQGSTCIGLDCVANESFGFDTLRLKENNLRIHFDDTSTTSGFPSNDWRILANDQNSGGGSLLTVEDATAARRPFTIEAAAPANALYVDSTGNIGIQQSAPSLDLHLTTNDTPAVRLEQTNAGGFAAQTWDIGANEANFFVRDLTSGSRLSFRIRPGAPTSSLDISSVGFVGVGTASPKRRLHVLGEAGPVDVFPPVIRETDGLVVENNSNAHVSIVSAAANSSVLRLVRSGSNDTRGYVQYAHPSDTLVLGAAGVPRVNVTATSVGVGNSSPTHPFVVGTADGSNRGNGAHVTAGGVWTNGSSRTFKKDIENLDADDAKHALAALQPVRYRYTTEPDEEYVGFIAEDVPELVAQTSEDRRYLSPMDIVATLTKVVQEQQKTIDELAKKVEQLEKQR